MKKPRVLVIAEAANPEWTSVPLIGWELSQALSRVADTHLVTQMRNGPAILRKGLIEGQDFSVIDNEAYAARLNSISARLRGGAGKGWTTTSAFASLAYYSFEHATWRQFRERLKAGEFDLVHRITPLSPTNQSLLAGRTAKLNIPFLVGPLNGGVPWPKAFRSRQHAENEWLSYVRGLYKLMPFYRSMRENSAAIIVGSRFAQHDMPASTAGKCIYIPENAVNMDLFGNPRPARISTPLKAAFVGRLVPYKGADILIEASIPFLRAGSLQLNIIGDGPEGPALRDKVRALKLDSAVNFHGWVPHDKVQDVLRDCDFLALPSVREFGGGVVLEAMALAVTPVVADYAGPSELVDDSTGIRVPFSDERSLIEGFRSAIAELIRAPERLNELGAAARTKVLENFTWDAKAQQILGIYQAVLGGTRDLRNLGL
ncbi:MAG: glycosyltransferase [Desulfobacterales bacterium]|nr:glycosyltransferase [Desulfobacterales bacterium]